MGAGQGELNPDPSTPLVAGNDTDDPIARRSRTLLLPAGWAFAVWAPIYLGETTFCAAQFVEGSGLASVLPAVTAPFVAANLYQAFGVPRFALRMTKDGINTLVSPCSVERLLVCRSC